MKKYTASWDAGPIASQVAVADSFFTRFRGLMLRKALAPGEGLLLNNAAPSTAALCGSPLM